MQRLAQRTVMAALCLACGALANSASGQDWTRFRGPNGTGISDAKMIPTKWTESDFNWRVDLPGVGHSQPVIWGDKLFVTSAVEQTAERIVQCLSTADGHELWHRRFASKTHPKHTLNSYASSTPAVDEDHVYVVWSTPDQNHLVALDHEGHDVWKLELGPFVGEHSSGTSPIVYEDMVVLGNDQGATRGNPDSVVSFLAAFDCKTGALRWKIDHKTKEAAYSTPCVFRPKGGPAELIFNSGAQGITSVNPAKGTVNWELAVFDKRTVSSPIVAEGLIFGTTGSGGGGNYVAAVKPGTENSPPVLAYKVDQNAPYVPTPVAHNGLMFLWSDAGLVSCVRAASGEPVWKKRVGGNYFGSPVCINGQLYCMSDDGECIVLAASADAKDAVHNPILEGSRSTPAVAGGKLYLRTSGHLISLGGKPAR